MRGATTWAADVTAVGAGGTTTFVSYFVLSGTSPFNINSLLSGGLTADGKDYTYSIITTGSEFSEISTAWANKFSTVAVGLYIVRFAKDYRGEPLNVFDSKDTMLTTPKCTFVKSPSFNEALCSLKITTPGT
jgi:hypothetical protein